jgi:hypothetical protein
VLGSIAEDGIVTLRVVPLQAELKASVAVCISSPGVAEVTLGHILVAQNASGKDMLEELTKTYDGDHLAAVVQMPSKAQGVWLTVSGTPISSSSPLLSLVSATRDSMRALLRPPVMESLAELRVMLAPGSCVRVDAAQPDPANVEMKDEETRLRKLIAKQPPLIKTIMEQGLGAPGMSRQGLGLPIYLLTYSLTYLPTCTYLLTYLLTLTLTLTLTQHPNPNPNSNPEPGMCAFEFSMCSHMKKRRGAHQGEVHTVIVPKFTCNMCHTTDPECIEDHSSTKRHLLLEKHLDAGIKSGNITGYTSAKDVIATIAASTDIDPKKKSLTSAGRRANSSQGKAVERGRQATALRNHLTAAMTAATTGHTPLGPGRVAVPLGPMSPEMMQQQLAGMMGLAQSPAPDAPGAAGVAPGQDVDGA